MCRFFEGTFVLRIGLVGLVLLAGVAGCEREAAVKPEAGKGAGGGSAATAPMMAECLVCNGHQIEVKAETPRLEYEGKMYYFCADGCKEAFGKEPGKYVVKGAETQASGAK